MERVLEVVRVATRQRKTLARIRWVGTNPQTLLPWRDSWVDVAWGMSASARVEVERLVLAKYGAGAARATRKRDRSPSPERQLGGVEVAKRAAWATRWGSLRSRKREADERESEEEDGPLRRAVRRGFRARRVVADEADGESDEA